jgi:hypothetical protein
LVDAMAVASQSERAAIDATLATLLDLEVRAISTGAETGETPALLRAALDDVPEVPQPAPEVVEAGTSLVLVESPRALTLLDQRRPTGILGIYKRTHVDGSGSVLADISIERLRNLHLQIDELYGEVMSRYGQLHQQAEVMLSTLREARQVLVERPEAFFDAEYLTIQVKVMLESKPRQARLVLRIGCELAWAALFIAGLVFSWPLVYAVTSLPAAIGLDPIIGLALWRAAMWGGLGAVAAVAVQLRRRVSQASGGGHGNLAGFLLRPISGVIVGCVLYTALYAGPSIIRETVMNDGSHSGARLLAYVAMALLGFVFSLMSGRLAWRVRRVSAQQGA